MWLLLIITPFLFILGYPYALHLDSQKLDEPVVVFTARSWRAGPWSLLMLGFAGFLLATAGWLATATATATGGGAGTALGALPLALLGLALGFIIFRLHFSYWRHDRYATFAINRPEQRADYRNQDVWLDFALADVVQVTEHSALGRSGRGPVWRNYSYHVFALRDGTEVLVTCLLYSLLGPQELVPTAHHAAVQHRVCWLPGDELNFPTLF